MTASLCKFPIKGAFAQARSTGELLSNGVDNGRLVFVNRSQLAASGFAQHDRQQGTNDHVVHQSGRFRGHLKCTALDGQFFLVEGGGRRFGDCRVRLA
ncbi:hypothetical protein [Pseudomonas sp. Sample_16]|uniref:hypothetical protein n=1 Tax=Pseudomonas sp. Sample_16 TaxID=2448263 RepID=UPI0015AAB4EF|nr:hypothetical protein [Pseudomonas sp. Sample_16]